jgi:hypothetical protein
MHRGGNRSTGAAFHLAKSRECLGRLGLLFGDEPIFCNVPGKIRARRRGPGEGEAMKGGLWTRTRAFQVDARASHWHGRRPKPEPGPAAA